MVSGKIYIFYIKNTKNLFFISHNTMNNICNLQQEDLFNKITKY